MSKSYTLADGSTVTVTATEQGIPFNEGMQALTKAIKAKITASSSGGASSGLLDPNLRIETDGDGNIVTWEGNGNCYIVSLNSVSPISKGYEVDNSPNTFVLTSDGTYDKDWVSNII